MVAENLAEGVYLATVEKLGRAKESNFFSENQEFLELAEGFSEIVRFLADRPAMLVDDATKPEKLIEFMLTEVREAVHAENYEAHEAYAKELGDCGFFGLLVGGLFWDELGDIDKIVVVSTLKWAKKKAEEHKIDLNGVIVDVSGVKNAKNYRTELHQLIPGETVEHVQERVPKIRTLHRDLRDMLNGKWAASTDLLTTLAHYWLDTLASSEPDTVAKIEQLFELTGLDLLDYAGEPT